MNNRDSVKISNLESLKRRYNLDVLDCISFETTDTEKSVILKASLQVLGTISQQSNDLSTILFPSGMSFEWNSNSIPSGYLEENGAAVSRTTFADLFAAIGTMFGSGDGSTTFNLPNSKGRVSIGLNSSDTWFDELGERGGEKEHLLTIAEMPAHHHALDESTTYNGGGNQVAVGANYNIVGSNANTNNTGGNAYHNNTQPFIVKRRIIKY